ncbi:TonB-dependent receptor [Desulfocarbo indianensis]|nr:TonB-dependent receptor [Desulfocarbo indianensis]
MKKLLFLTASLLLLPALCAAESSLSAPEQSSSGRDPYLLEKITVTAGKRESDLKEYPGSVSVVSETALEMKGAWDLSEALQMVPNAYMKNTTSGNAVIIRGLSTIDTSLFSPAGLYVDDVAYPLNYMQDLDLMDVERLEVSRGPQGTLYGANSEAGVINVVLAQPGPETRAKANAEYGDYNRLRLAASVSGPVYQDKLFIGASALRTTTDGYVTNLSKDDDRAGKREVTGGRLSLRYVPSQAWDLSLSMDGRNKNLGLGALRYLSGPNRTEAYDVKSNAADLAHENSLDQSLRVKHSGDWADFVSITSHRGYGYDFIMDVDRSATPMGESDVDLELGSWSQEFRLSSKRPGPLAWLVGAYGKQDNLEVTMARNFAVAARSYKLKTDSDLQSCAAFGQATYTIADGLRFTAGLRLEISGASGDQHYKSLSADRKYSRDLDSTELLPMAALSYDLNRHLTMYASFSTGHLAGGYNYFSANSLDAFSYEPEYTYNYEAGLKTSWLEGKLLGNLALFHTDIRDKQVREESPGGGVGVWRFSNAAQAHSTGGELELTARPLSGLVISAGVGYAFTEVDQWSVNNGGVSTDYAGKHLPWAPDLTYNLAVSYHHPSGLFARADLFGAGEQYFDAANSLSDDGYQLVGARLGYEWSRCNLSLWIKNAFNETHATKKVLDNSGNIMVQDGDPRTFGVSLNWRF